MLDQEELQPDPIIVKPSRGERIKRSIAARLRRKEVKTIKSVHQLKEEKEAKERLRAKRKLERQKKRNRKKLAS